MKPRSAHAGLTLVELIVVLILAGIVLAVVMPRWSGHTGFEERGFRDEVAAALRYAQKSAIAARRTVCVTFAAAPSSVALRISRDFGAADCTSGTPLAGPDGQPYVLRAHAPAAFAAVPVALVFDAAGRPDAAAVLGFTGLPGALNLTVEAETGYVH